MPVKQRNRRHDFNVLLPTDDRPQTEESTRVVDIDEYSSRVLRASEAPTNSKFYTDAQLLFSFVEKDQN